MEEAWQNWGLDASLAQSVDTEIRCKWCDRKQRPVGEPMRYSHDRPFRALELGKRAVQYGSRAREQSHLL